jgi:GNAT superfamily N-acetyltransferase
MARQFRAAVPGDIPACVRLRGRTRENAVSVERLAALGITAASWARDLQSGALPGFVCMDDGVIVGYGFGKRATGEIAVLALLPGHEGQGIGRQLLGLVVGVLAAAGHRRLFLGCSRDPATRSHGFYRHLGWVPTGRIDRAGDEVLELHLHGDDEVPGEAGRRA